MGIGKWRKFLIIEDYDKLLKKLSDFIKDYWE